MRRWVRRLGTLLVVAGAGVLAWAVLVWAWQDPFTSLYTRWEQHRLAQSYSRLFDAYRPPHEAASLVAVRRELLLLRAEAAQYRRATHRGEAIGRIVVPR